MDHSGTPDPEGEGADDGTRPGGEVPGAAVTTDWLWPSLVATALLPPVGMVALVQAVGARRARRRGQGPLARRRTSRARAWALAGIGGGVFLAFAWYGLAQSAL